MELPDCKYQPSYIYDPIITDKDHYHSIKRGFLPTDVGKTG